MRDKNRTTIGSSNSNPRYLSEKNQNTYLKRYMPPDVLALTLFTIAKIWKQPKCLLTDEWIKK